MVELRCVGLHGVFVVLNGAMRQVVAVEVGLVYRFLPRGE